jgi:hypothetical protein
MAGHDASHVLRMIDIGRQITHLPGLDLQVYDVAVWLHNLDRLPAEVRRRPVEQALIEFLDVSPFSDSERTVIYMAVLAHAKFSSDPEDSDILKALQAADKVDRLGPRGVLTAAQIHAHRPLYDPTRDPFRVQLGEGGWPFTVYDDIAGRVMEWPLMMPPESRYLISRDRMRGLIGYVRAMADEACQAHGLTNGVEDDLARALGPELYVLYAA